MITFHRLILFGIDIDLLKAFYTENFGFKVIEEIPTKWVVLKNEGAEIAFHKIGDSYVDATKPFKVNSNTKMVFNIDDGLVRLREKLIEAEVQMKEMISFGNPKYFYCDGEDPEGNVFQLMQKARE